MDYAKHANNLNTIIIRYFLKNIQLKVIIDKNLIISMEKKKKKK